MTLKSQIVAEVYEALAHANKITYSADNIAYTDDFELVYERIIRRLDMSRHEIFQTLINCRKQGRCQKSKRSRRRSRITRAKFQIVAEVYESLDASGKITYSADNIAYTDDFELVYRKVSRLTDMSRHDVCLTLINCRKRGRCKKSKLTSSTH